MMLGYMRNFIKYNLCGSVRKKIKVPKRYRYNSCEPVDPRQDIPYVDVYENDPDTAINMRNFCCGRKIVIIGLPGAFTPICTARHLPGYIRRAEEFRKFGVDEIVCISINDPYVMCAWGKYHNAHGKVRMFADTDGHFTKALDLDIDLPRLGGLRSKRYSMVVSDAKIQTMNVEPDGVGLSVSSAECLVV